MLTRKYSQKTLKVLFALSGNQCAHPECKNPVIVPPSKESDALVLNQICHIYALNEDGPRGKVGLTEKELNAPENLILLCPTHHVIIDGQYESYPAVVLKEWKRTHELAIQKRISADLDSVQADVFSHPYFPTALVDQKIEDEVALLRKSRFFMEFDTVRSSLALARKLVGGELSGGTDAVRCRALAWCARLLTLTELHKAEEYLKLARGVGHCPEIEIANAFICSQKGDRGTALSALAGIDTPISRSAALMIVTHHDGAEGALNWLETSGIKPMDLDPDGKHFLLSQQLRLSRWEAAREALDALTDEDLRDAPVLHHIMAITYLLTTVPTEFRAVVLNQLPLDAASFRLASDAAAIDARRIARWHFTNATEIAQQLNFPRAATIDEGYALWLELKDPVTFNEGKQRLEEKLRDPKSALHLVPLALQFGIKLDLEAVEQKIEQQIVLHGGITPDAAIARFALAFTQKTPEDIAGYLARHYDELSEYLEKKTMRSIQIEMFSQAGLTERASDCLKLLLEEGLSETEVSRLRRVISEAEGADRIEARKVQFKETDSLADLFVLVDELESREEWNSLCEYGEILFARTRSVSDAERLAKALSNSQKTERLVELLKGNVDLLGQSKNLRLLYCWTLYQQGALLEAQSELAKLSDDRENQYHRALQVNLGIALGDWNSLAAFVAKEYVERDKRSAHDLMGVAQLALHLGSPHAKELVVAAASKGEDDAGVLAAAYFLASNAGWEADAEVVRWLHKAAALSGDNGPIQQMTLKDLLDRKPEWDRRESETWQLLGHGEIPMFLAAQSLNKSLIELMLFPSLANLSERDPRRRGAIPAYSGKRPPTSLDTAGTVGMDATALLTLSVLNILEKSIDAFQTVYVPHSTLTWLFEEKRKAAFVQPSRVRDAYQVRHLLSTDALEKFIPSTMADSDLSAQVGDELAMLVAEAEKVREDDNTQRIVVRSSPVHRIASLMEEEADLTEHSAVISSCLSVVNKLRIEGQITKEEEKKARSYLQLHEKPWLNQPEVQDGAILYLDDLALTYFLHLGILEKLKPAGFRPIASPRGVSETNALIAYERISGKVNEVIEHLRAAISSQIKTGRIKIGRRRKVDKLQDQSISEHPTVGVLTLAGDCDAIISDDRFLNQHRNITDGNAQAPVFSTLDVLDALAYAGAITREDRSEYRTMLRRAGYFFVPVSYDELSTYLDASPVMDNKIVETAELKAIRENILRVRMSDWLQLPKEVLWLDMTLKVFIRVLKSLWKADADVPSVTARSNWILEQIEVRGWAHSLGSENGDSLVRTGRGTHILMTLIPLTDAPQDIKDAYWKWVEDRILAPVKEQYTDLYAWIVEWEKRYIAEMAGTKLSQGKTA